MKCANRVLAIIASSVLLLYATGAAAQDWPQWRGPNRDAKATGFNAPATWPATLTKKWDVPVGNGVANPSLVGDRLYVIAREGNDEVLRCLDATTGDEIWKKSYPSDPATGAASGFPGPRSSPTVADGKVITNSVQGLLTCWDAASGDQLWQKNEFEGNVPRFFTSSSPIIVDRMCVAQLGARNGGAMVAYDLASGDEKWRSAAGAADYGSPVLMTFDGMKVVIAPSATDLIAVNTADGNVVWQIPYQQGRYNSSTPIVDGQTLIIAGPGSGMTAVRLSREGDSLTEEELWRYTGNDLIYNSPVLKDGAIYGLSTGSNLFCVTPDHETGWAEPIAGAAGVGMLAPDQGQAVFAQQRGEGRGRGQGRGRGRQGRGGGRRGGGGGRPGYGSIVDVGPALLALSPAADLVVFQPSADSYNEVARYKVSEDGGTYSYPIPSGNRIYVKDQDSVSMWTVE